MAKGGQNCVTNQSNLLTIRKKLYKIARSYKVVQGCKVIRYGNIVSRSFDVAVLYPAIPVV